MRTFDPSGRYTKEFLKLQFEWDRKLKESGFDSVEHRNPDGNMSHHIRDNSVDVARKWRFDVQRYFELAGYWRWHRHHPAWTKLQRALWQEHCKGTSNNKIIEECQKFLREEPKKMLKHSEAVCTISHSRAHATAVRSNDYDSDD